MSVVLCEPLMLSLSSQSMSIAFLQFICGNAVFPFHIAYVFSLLLTELCHCRSFDFGMVFELPYCRLEHCGKSGGTTSVMWDGCSAMRLSRSSYASSASRASDAFPSPTIDLGLPYGPNASCLFKGVIRPQMHGIALLDKMSLPWISWKVLSGTYRLGFEIAV